MPIAELISEYQTLAVQRDSLVTQVADLENQILTANLQHGNDLAVIGGLKTALANDDAMLAADSETISKFAAQLQQVQMQLAAFPNLQFIDGYETNPVVMDVNNKAFATWSPRVGPNIGGETPSRYSAQWVNGKLVLSVTGIPPNPGKHWCDWLLVNKRPPLPPSVKTFALDFAITPDGSPSTQCLEFDSIDVLAGWESNLSSQWVASSGKIQIANGATKGGWMDSGVVVILAPNVRHTVRWIYGIDRAAKTCQYIAFILDGKRYDIDPKVGIQPAYQQAQPWGDQLALQLQQDVNSQGGSLTTIFDSIRYMYVANV